MRAPGRINLIGEHTDYNGGLVLPAAIDKAIWLAADVRADNRLVFHAVDMDETFEGDGAAPVFQQQKTWANYLLGVISELQQDGHPVGGLNLTFGGDIPMGAGLSSSAALECGMAALLNELFRLGLSKMQLVQIARRGENRFVGMQCGIMDMFCSVMGRENHLIRLDCRSLEYACFPFETEDYSLLLLDSGVKHQLVDSEYNTRRMECETGVMMLKKHYPGIETLRDVSPDMLQAHHIELPEKVYRRCAFVVAEITRVEAACRALESGDFQQLGQLMYACHDGLSRQYEVCVAETDFLVERARKIAAGARQMGGGFGGCTINLLRTDQAAHFIETMTAQYRDVFGKELKAWPVKTADGVEVIKMRR